MPRVTRPLREAKSRAVSSVISSGFVSVQNRLVEGHPAEGRAGFDDFVEAAVLAFAERDRFSGAQIVPHDFGEQLAAAANFRREALADDIAQGVGQPDAQLLFFA